MAKKGHTTAVVEKIAMVLYILPRLTTWRYVQYQHDFHYNHDGKFNFFLNGSSDEKYLVAIYNLHFSEFYKLVIFTYFFVKQYFHRCKLYQISKHTKYNTKIVKN